MSKVKTYHRPQTVDEAVVLLRESGTVVLAGGTQLIPNSQDIEAVVDLQAVGLNQIEVTADTITIGAMVRLQEIVDHPDVPKLVRQMAQREGPNSFRNVGTIGGVVALADWESELYAALLLFEAMVTVQSAAGEQSCQLFESWQLSEGELITAVTIQTSGVTAFERVARTPADKPIVAILARQTKNGTRLAACGLADKPILITEADLGSLRPPADFRGSAVYRTEMAKVLVNRVRRQVSK